VTESPAETETPGEISTSAAQAADLGGKLSSPGIHCSPNHTNTGAGYSGSGFSGDFGCFGILDHGQFRGEIDGDQQFVGRIIARPLRCPTAYIAEQGLNYAPPYSGRCCEHVRAATKIYYFSLS